MELLVYWRIIRKHIWLILMLMLAGAITAAYISRQQPPVYRATALLYINPSNSARASPIQVVQSAKALADTYSEFMRTRSFAEFVAQELGMPGTEGTIARALTSRVVGDTQFFSITATATDPEFAQRLANTAATVLIERNVARQQAELEQVKAQSDPAYLLQRQRLDELQTLLQGELAAYDDQLTRMEAQLSELEAADKTVENEAQIASLRTEILRLRELRVDVLRSLATTQAALAEMTNLTPEVDTAVVVDEARLRTTPLPAKTVENTLLALVVCAILGAGLAFFLEYTDFTIRTPEMLESVYGLPAQGAIGVAHGDVSDRLVMVNAPQSATAEAFRALRTSVQVAGLHGPLRSLLITSAVPCEGKSFVAANLAASLAQNGSWVILVDTDLRRPRLHALFGLPPKPGFTNLVAEHPSDVSSFLQATGVENLWLLPSGPLPRNPAELLGSRSAAALMEQLKEHADFIIYDSPPVTTVTDAVVLATRMDGVLQVVLAGGPRVDQVRRGKAMLERVGGRLLGPVLNRAAEPDLGLYSFSTYGPLAEPGPKPARERPVSTRDLLG